MGDLQQEDELLVQRARDGDRSAFDALVRKHEHRAFQFAFRLSRNSDEAADIVAEAFLRVYNALGNFKGQSTFTTWLYRILTNCFLDMRKREKNKQTYSLDEVMPDSPGDLTRQVEDPSGTPQDRIEQNERERRLQRALRRLPDYQRAMIVMYHAEGLSYEEIAEALDLPVGTVKSRLNRARLSLREILVRDEELFRI